MDSPTIEFGRMPYEISPMGIYEDNDEYSVNCDVWWSYVPFLMYLWLQFAILCRFQSTYL